MCAQPVSRVSLRPRGQPASLLCPWASPGNTGVGCHALLQGIFPIQRANLRLLHWPADSLQLRHLGSPFYGPEHTFFPTGNSCKYFKKALGTFPYILLFL